MNTFSADYSSSIASSHAETPQRRKNLFSNGPDLASTTPLVPPPASVFGSSRFGSGVNKPLFAKPDSSAADRSTPASLETRQTSSKKSLAYTPARPFHTSFGDSLDSEYNEPSPSYGEYHEPRSENHTVAQSLLRFSPSTSRKSPKRSLHHKPSESPCKLQRRGRPEHVPGLARDLTAHVKPAALTERDDLILESEHILQQLQQHSVTPTESSSGIDDAAQELRFLWNDFVQSSSKERQSAEIGLPPTASGFDKAEHVASLLLALYHPPTPLAGQQVSIPKAILEWLDHRHVSYNHMYQMVRQTKPNETAHEYFWDAIHSMALRGHLHDVIRILGEADFKYAATSVDDDGEEERGYHGTQLQTIQSTIYEARQIVNACPGAKDDWDTFSETWDIYRNDLETELEMLARSAGQDLEDGEDAFEAENFGVRKSQTGLLGRSQKGRKLPWSIYQGLRILYSILRGSVEEITALSQDWLEASCALTVWWDGSADTKVANWSLDVSRANDQQLDGELPSDSYLGRLRDSFLYVTDPDDKTTTPIKNLSPVEVGLACVLQGQMNALVRILQALSQPVADGIVEIAAAAGWLGLGRQVQSSDLSSVDLMVLSYGGPSATLDRDEVLQGYASALFGHQPLRSSDGTTTLGWELSISILRRLDDSDLMRECLSDLLDQLDLADSSQAERAIYVCTELGLIDEARRLSERYGDQLVSGTTHYGLAMLCYTKSRSIHKIRQLTDLLISYCLVQSRAYPDQEEMDDALRALVGSPRSAFTDILEADPEAGAELQFYMAGYACMRKFYAFRDQGTTGGKQNKPLLLSAKRGAAKPLLAAINSAADGIYGGLYDSDRQAAIQVDGLLTLLGEATALMSSTTDKQILTPNEMYALLAAIEDLETVNARVYDATEECFQASLRNYHGSLPPSPHAMLKKSMSSGTNSNFSFSMMGSEMLASSKESVGQTSVGSAVLVGGGKSDASRAWDWRSSFKGDDVTGRDVLQYLRSSIAKELSLAELV